MLFLNNFYYASKGYRKVPGEQILRLLDDGVTSFIQELLMKKVILLNQNKL